MCIVVRVNQWNHVWDLDNFTLTRNFMCLIWLVSERINLRIPKCQCNSVGMPGCFCFIWSISSCPLGLCFDLICFKLKKLHLNSLERQYWIWMYTKQYITETKWIMFHFKVKFPSFFNNTIWRFDKQSKIIWNNKSAHLIYSGIRFKIMLKICNHHLHRYIFPIPNADPSA